MTTENLFEYCPFLTSANVTLSRAGAADADALFALMRDPELSKYEPEQPAKRLTEAERRLQQADELFAGGKAVLLGVYANTDLGRMIGWVEIGGIHRSLSMIQLRFQFEENALQTELPMEALWSLTRYLFSMVRANRVQVVSLAEDEPKHKLLEAAGFHAEGVLRAYRKWRDDSLADIAFHAMLASDFAALRDNDHTFDPEAAYEADESPEEIAEEAAEEETGVEAPEGTAEEPSEEAALDPSGEADEIAAELEKELSEGIAGDAEDNAWAFLDDDLSEHAFEEIEGDD